MHSLNYFSAFYIVGVLQVEAILDKENFTLEELLDEEEVIQECKALNSRLINLYVSIYFKHKVLPVFITSISFVHFLFGSVQFLQKGQQSVVTCKAPTIIMSREGSDLLCVYFGQFYLLFARGYYMTQTCDLIKM